LLGLLFHPEDGSDMFLRNVGLATAQKTALFKLIRALKINVCKEQPAGMLCFDERLANLS
jgi:hypothetical protein